MVKTKTSKKTLKGPDAKAGKPAESHYTPVSAESVSHRAYELWEKRGCVHGYHIEDWLRAEKELAQDSIE